MEEAKKPEEGQGGPPAGSAPAGAPASAPPVEGSKKPAQEAPKTGAEAAKAFFALRNEKKETEAKAAELAARNAKLEAELKALQEERSTRKAEGAGASSASIFEDPDGWAASVKKQIREDIYRGIREEATAARIESESTAAGEWLLSRKHIQEDPQFREETKAIIAARYAEVANVNPTAAARLAYEDVCKLKGVEPDESEKELHPSAARASAGVRTSAPAGGKGGPRSWTETEANEYIRSAYGTPDYSRRAAEVREAIKAGKIVKG